MSLVVVSLGSEKKHPERIQKQIDRFQTDEGIKNQVETS